MSSASCFLAAPLTKTLKIDRFPQHSAPPANGRGNADIIKRLVMKINNLFAACALEMLMSLHICVKPFRVTGTFDHKRNPNVT
jgi:hypothetical protein